MKLKAWRGTKENDIILRESRITETLDDREKKKFKTALPIHKIKRNTKSLGIFATTSSTREKHN